MTIVNVCVKKNQMVDENYCNAECVLECRHAGEATVKMRCDIYTHSQEEENQ